MKKEKLTPRLDNVIQIKDITDDKLQNTIQKYIKSKNKNSRLVCK